MDLLAPFFEQFTLSARMFYSGAFCGISPSLEEHAGYLHVLKKGRLTQGLRIAAYVLMPEHVHLLTSEPETGTLATFLQILKQLTSRELKSPNQKQLWQRRYYDFNVSTPEKFAEKLQYIHRNPIKRGLVTKPEDYCWSSFNHYATGEPHPVEIESQWTARRRERAAQATSAF
jgi:putative transposase